MVLQVIGWIIGTGLAFALIIGMIVAGPLISLYAINCLLAGHLFLDYSMTNWLCLAWFHLLGIITLSSK